jgi:aminopeptidase N
VLAALSLLADRSEEERDQAFAEFYEKWRDEALVIDKWFALQATIPDPATLDRVKVLMTHPAFSIANPNRVRALIGSFVQMNPTQFNRADGAGFAFLADTVLALDLKNPQVSARVTTAFRSWRALEPTRRGHAEAALRRIAAAPNLSRDLRDIVERSLATS